MAVINSESLVLHGVRVAFDVVTGLERIGSNPASGQTGAMHLSVTRHPSQSYPDANGDPGTRPESAENLGAARAAKRAGRPGSSAGVPDSRNLAITARRAILSGWSLAARGPVPPATWCQRRFTAVPSVAVGEVLSGHSQPSLSQTLRAGNQWRLPRPQRSEKGGERPASLMPAMGRLSASARGK
jgi:hypothetical protein